MEPFLLLVLSVIFVVNIVFAPGTVFVERRSPETALAWVAILLFVPLPGFLLYILLGQNFHRNRLFRLKAGDDRKLQEEVSGQLRILSAVEEAGKDDRLRRYMGIQDEGMGERLPALLPHPLINPSRWRWYPARHGVSITRHARHPP